MTTRLTFSDEELTAYLDGESEPQLMEAITYAIEHSAELSVRVDALSIDPSRIKDAFNELITEAPEAPGFLTKPEYESRGFSLGSFAATALLFTVIGWSLAYFIPDEQDNSWQEFVASYQGLYTVDTLFHINQTEKQATLELTRVGAVIGKQIDLLALSNNSQLGYKRAQILGFKDKPLIQLAFLSEAGVPIALCIMKSENTNEKGIQLDTMRDMRTAAWSKKGYDYLLIGGEDKNLIQKAATVFSKHI